MEGMTDGDRRRELLATLVEAVLRLSALAGLLLFAWGLGRIHGSDGSDGDGNGGPEDRPAHRAEAAR